MNNNKISTITLQNSASLTRGTINSALLRNIRRPTKLRLLESATVCLAKHGIKRFCLDTVLTNCDISKEQFGNIFDDERALIRAVFSDLYSRLGDITRTVHKDDYSPYERIILYVDELKIFFLEPTNLLLTHHLATDGKRFYGNKGYGIDYLFFQDLFRKSLSMLMAEVMESKTAWNLCQKYAKQFKNAATEGTSALKTSIDWISDEVLIAVSE